MSRGVKPGAMPRPADSAGAPRGGRLRRHDGDGAAPADRSRAARSSRTLDDLYHAPSSNRHRSGRDFNHQGHPYRRRRGASPTAVGRSRPRERANRRCGWRRVFDGPRRHRLAWALSQRRSHASGLGLGRCGRQCPDVTPSQTSQLRRDAAARGRQQQGRRGRSMPCWISALTSRPRARSSREERRSPMR